MKKYILIIFVFAVSFFSTLFAQNSESNKNVFIQTGMVNYLGGYNIAGGFEKKFGSSNLNGLDVAFNFQKVDHFISSVDVTTNEKSYFLSANYKRYFETLSFNKFLPYGSIGALGGLTHIGKEDNGIYHVSEQNKFLYGAISSVGVEYQLNRLAPYIEGSYYFTGDHYFRINIGFKYNF